MVRWLVVVMVVGCSGNVGMCVYSYCHTCVVSRGGGGSGNVDGVDSGVGIADGGRICTLSHTSTTLSSATTTATTRATTTTVTTITTITTTEAEALLQLLIFPTFFCLSFLTLPLLCGFHCRGLSGFRLFVTQPTLGR